MSTTSSTASTSQPVTPATSPRRQSAAAVKLSGDEQIYEWNQTVRSYESDGCLLPNDVLSDLHALIDLDDEHEHVDTATPAAAPLRLNPSAAAFQPKRPTSPTTNTSTPTSTSTSISSSHCSSLSESDSLPSEPRWTASFHKGTRRHPEDYSALAQDAATLVASPSFSHRDTHALADMFVDRAAYLRGPETIVPFAVEVHGTLSRLLGPDEAESFRAYLAEVTALTFSNVWEQEIPEAQKRSTALALELTVTGLSLGAFLASLHRSTMLSGALVTRALASLLFHCPDPSMEHVQCARNLMCGVGPKYFSMAPEARERVWAHFSHWAREVEADRTLVGVKYGEETKWGWFREVEERVRGASDVAYPEVRRSATPDARRSAIPDARRSATPDSRRSATPDSRRSATPEVRTREEQARQLEERERIVRGIKEANRQRLEM